MEVKKKISFRQVDAMRKKLAGLNINTICAEARCPNITECCLRSQATFLILGTVCTRNCRFCNVSKGLPDGVDKTEPDRIAEAVSRLELSHVVITSPTRDDLEDGGADIYSRTVAAVKKQNPNTVIEILIPDFKNSGTAIDTVLEASPHIAGHNMETVRRLYSLRGGAEYRNSLSVLKSIKRSRNGIRAKSAFMLGLGETENEVAELMSDIRETRCDYLCIGQYLAPSAQHESVYEYISENKFSFFRDMGYEMGFLSVVSGKYVRSSYCPELYLKGEEA